MGAGLAREWSAMDAIACKAGSHRQALTRAPFQRTGTYVRKLTPTGDLVMEKVDEAHPKAALDQPYALQVPLDTVLPW